MCKGPTLELPWLKPQCLVLCYFESTIGISLPCLLLQTLLYALLHVMAFHIIGSPHQLAPKRLSDVCTQSSDIQILLFCWHRALGFALLFSQHALCCVRLCLLPVDVQSRCAWLWVEHAMHGHQLPSRCVCSFKIFLMPGDNGCSAPDNWHCKGVDCHYLVFSCLTADSWVPILLGSCTPRSLSSSSNRSISSSSSSSSSCCCCC